MLKKLLYCCIVFILTTTLSLQLEFDQNLGYQFGYNLNDYDTPFDSFSVNVNVSEDLIFGFGFNGGYLFRYSPTTFSSLSESIFLHTQYVGVTYSKLFDKSVKMYLTTNINIGLSFYDIFKFYQFQYTYMFTIQVGFPITEDLSIFGQLSYIGDNFKDTTLQSISPSIGVKYFFRF